MRTKSKQREQTPRTYKMIHFKNACDTGKRLSTHQDEKSSQYFPVKILGKEIEKYYLDSSSASVSNREHSASSRTLTIDNGVGSNFIQENKSLKKEIKKLRLELLKKEKIVAERDDKGAILKKLQSELAETYRVIQFYQIKTKELERVCQDYEQAFNQPQPSKRQKQIKVSELLQQQREYNIELRIELDNKQRVIDQMKRQLGNLSLKKVQNQYQIKNLEKKALEQEKRRVFQEGRQKFVDDYEQQHLAINKVNQPSKKRTMPSKKKIILKTNSGGQSSGEESVNGNQYRSSLYLKKRGGLLRDSNRDSSAVKATMYGNLQSKINNIEKEVENLRKQNDRLQTELDCKLSELLKLKNTNHDLQIKLTFLEEASRKPMSNPPNKIMISKELLKEIPKPTLSASNIQLPASEDKSSDNKLSMFVSNVSPQFSKQARVQENLPRQKSTKKSKKSSNYKATSLKDLTIRKLIVNVIKSELSYEDLINLIASCWSAQDPKCILEQLQGSPCNLSSQEGQEFLLEFKQVLRFISNKEGLQAKKDLGPQQYRQYFKAELVDLLRDIIPSYKNITFRRQFTLNIQLSNKFKNYEKEFKELVQKYGDRMRYSECEESLVGCWGFSEEQFMCLLVKNYEQNGQIQNIHLAQIGKFYLTD